MLKLDNVCIRIHLKVDIMVLMSSGLRKPVTWPRWCHNDTTTLRTLTSVSFEIIGLQWTVFEIFALTSFRPKKPVTWLRWRHNDITSRKTMVTLVGVSFEIIVLQRAVSEIFVLTSSRFEKADTLPEWCHHYVFRVRNASHVTTIASLRRHQLKAEGQFCRCFFWMIVVTHAVSEILSVIHENDCWSICDE